MIMLSHAGSNWGFLDKEGERVIFGNQGMSISYDDIGSGNAVLFIHGHLFNRTMWSSQVQSLRWKYRTVAPDLRGYGQSSPGPDPVSTLESLAGDLIRLLDHLSVARVCVVGLSLGGQVAMEFVRAFPDRTAGAVFAATFPQAETTDGVKHRNRMAERLLIEGTAFAGSEMLPKLISPTSLKNHPSIAASVYQMICATDPAGAAAALRGRALRRDYRESLTQLKAPCLIVIGTDDAYSTVDEAQAMRVAIQGSRLEVFPNVGHMPNLENEDRFNRHLRDFLATVSW
jgi:pimeloyl-ACP methyl ester carboxylesterase